MKKSKRHRYQRSGAADGKAVEPEASANCLYPMSLFECAFTSTNVHLLTCPVATHKQIYSTDVAQSTHQLYLDVVPMLATWKSRHLKLLIYSSGSVQAQQLLFSHTTEGDVTRLLDGYFDINTAGVKTDARSYEVISQAINTIPSKILFLTDIVADVLRCCLLSTCQTRIARSLGHRLAASRSVQEAQAARRAGFQVRLVVRPGNKPLSEDEKASFSCIGSLEQIEL
ncbi:enolase-phosphatase E1 isoform X5 [Rhipicephalus microplus]|uniref:enolase-phosphatase E1 isoform X5 n=1 Tax=Rhipicephalus microplus TaxID=6941 RepID=UPI003F6C291A